MPAPETASRIELAGPPNAAVLAPVCVACARLVSSNVESATAFERGKDDGEAPPSFSQDRYDRAR